MPLHTMNQVRKFKSISDGKIMQLRNKWIKKRNFNKMQCGVKAFKEWRKQKIDNCPNVDPSIVSADLSMLIP